MATKPAPDWLEFEVVHEPDPETEVAALVSLIEYSREHRLSERYPTSEALATALRAREAHFIACTTCTADALCDEWWRLAAVADAAIEDERRAAL